MSKSIIAEGKTSTEAIEKGLRELKVSKDKVEIKILENEEKRSFFSILTPRVVKVELTLKENHGKGKETKQVEERKEHTKQSDKNNSLNEEEKAKVKENLTSFLNEFTANLSNVQYEISSDDEYIYVTLNGEDAGRLIGYRGETLNSLQTILSSIANKNIEKKVHIILDIENYREKRKVALEELADKLTRTVIRTGKQVTLEPMSAYERKTIHNRLQSSQRVKTFSIGEEPYRKVVISKK